MSRVRAFRLRRIVRDYSLEAIEAFPDASPEEIETYVREAISSDFGTSNWLPVLLQLISVVLPILLELFDRKPS